MFKIFFTIIFSFSLFFMAFNPEDCYAQRMKKSGGNRNFQKPNTDRSSKKTISGKDFKTKDKGNRDFKDIDKKNNDIRKDKELKRNDKDINRNDKDFNRGDKNFNNDRDININNNTNVYHGYSYSGGHPYSYHSYSPYRWGAYWHPAGFFVATMFTAAVLISISNQNYYYYEGVYYSPSGSGYVVVQAPVNAEITVLPSDYTTVIVTPTTYYYYGGVFYTLSGSSYVVVEAPIGAVVSNLPEGAEEVEINGVKLLKYNSAFFQPVSQNGDDAYEVVKVQK